MCLYLSIFYHTSIDNVVNYVYILSIVPYGQNNIIAPARLAPTTAQRQCGVVLCSSSVQFKKPGHRNLLYTIRAYRTIRPYRPIYYIWGLFSMLFFQCSAIYSQPWASSLWLVATGAINNYYLRGSALIIILLYSNYWFKNTHVHLHI